MIFMSRTCSGGHSERETPGPIPNPEVKPPSADGTAHASVWESKTPPDTQNHKCPHTPQTRVGAQPHPTTTPPTREHADVLVIMGWFPAVLPVNLRPG